MAPVDKQEVVLLVERSAPGSVLPSICRCLRGRRQRSGRPFATHSYDVSFLVALAIEKTGAADRGAISASLREVANAPGMVIRPGEWAGPRKPSR